MDLAINALRVLLPSGNRNDICLVKIMESLDLAGKLILADQGYNSDKFVRWVKVRGKIPVISRQIVQGIKGKQIVTSINNGIESKIYFRS